MTAEREVPGPSLLAVAPVFNEAPIIGEFLRRVADLQGRVDLRGLVLVDDGSTDATCARIQQFVSDTRTGLRIRLVRLTRNFGHQIAVLAGLAAAGAWAEREQIEFVGLIDADLQDRPEHFADLMRATDGADVVYAQRASRAEGPMFRFLATQFYRLLAATSKHPIPTQAGTFSVMRRRVVEVILANADRSPYFPGLRAWAGYRQKGLPLQRDERYAGSSKVGFGGLLRLAVNAVFSYSDIPMRLMFVFASVVLGVSTLAALTMVVLKLLGAVEVQGTALIIVSIFFSLGVQSVYLLAISYMLTRSASEASRKQSYLVMDEQELRHD